MEKKKLKLQEIKVNSFITQSGESKKTIKGGDDSGAGVICITFEATTVATPTTIFLGATQATTTIGSIITITTETNGKNTQSGYAVACSRFNCATYANIGAPCAAV